MSWVKKLLILCLILFLSGLLTIAGLYLYVKKDLPDVTTLQDVRLQTPMQVFTADGELISQFGEKRRIPLTLEQMPPLLIEAFLAVEDTRFYEHPGIDIIGILRAVTVIASSGDFSQGASTITQQLARNFFLSREKKIMRKIKEVFLAFHIEQLLSKDKILELYLNKIELGQRSFGVGAAAQVYFGKTVDQLSLDEIAIIAGLPKAPSALNPVRSPANARARRNIVLYRMLDVGAIDKAAYDAAIQAPVVSRLHGAQITASAPYIAEMVRQEMVNRFGEELAYSAGLRVITTINSQQQATAKHSLQQNLYEYDERHGYRGPVDTLWQATLKPDVTEQPDYDQPDRLDTEQIIAYLDQQKGLEDLVPAVVTQVNSQTVQVILSGGTEATIEWEGLKWARSFITDRRQGNAPKTADAILAPGMHILVRQHQKQWRLSQIPEATSAIVAIDPHDGAVRSLVGGFSFSQSQFNRVTQAKRQVGSNIKPFIYSAALANGYTLASIMNDAPIHQWDDNAGIAWRPKNSPAVYDGPIRIREALAKSKNVVSIRLLRGVGIDKTIEHLQRFGFAASDLPRNETLALGSASLTPMEVVTGFAVFANGGYLVKPYLIDSIIDAEQNTIYQHQAAIACDDCEDFAAKTPELAPELNSEAQMQQLFNRLSHDQTTEAELDAASLPSQQPEVAQRVLDKQNSFLVADALTTSVWGGGDWRAGTGWNGTAWRLQTLKRRDVSAKTGTTNDSKDTWFSGFTADLAVTVWVGFDDANRSLGRALWHANMGQSQSAGTESGARTALPGWLDYMQQILPSLPSKAPTPPVGLASVRIDLNSGLLSRKTDTSSSFEYFISGTEPTQYSGNDVQPISFDSNSPPVDKDIELF
ncbi:penicillin-binding protein 1A [Rheinheimera salexigens]|uniref:Penicillin-binding protein 1A n=1 Tax=Rheinheimera salexigens TaxID=1628148 RepID=A0A1E7Q4A2_9GAMM|nr:PBP1A family penicillin-binding protein [Rheinheimera salexigens]OEY69005.1 penicillin-sensitive transpeptidase [Rheinheimera salexigens]